MEDIPKYSKYSILKNSKFKLVIIRKMKKKLGHIFFNARNE